jgi:succinate dehydrogenase / fumarate reductase, cytochrome b subunit
MAVSILNRVMGVGLATAGVVALVWWLTAASSGPEAYAAFISCASGWMGKVIAVSLTFAFFFHLCAGIRHFVLDTGAGFELKSNRLWALGTFLASIFLTGTVWLSVVYKGL